MPELTSSTVPGSRLVVSDEQAEIYLARGWRPVESSSDTSDKEKPHGNRRRKPDTSDSE